MKALLLVVLSSWGAGNARVTVQTKASLNLPTPVITASQLPLGTGNNPGVFGKLSTIEVKDSPKVRLDDLTAKLGNGNNDGGSSEAVLNTSYDKAVEGDKGGTVMAETGGSVSQNHAAAELALYKAHANRFPNSKPVENVGWGRRAWEFAELGVYSIPFHIAALIALSNEAWPILQAGIWTAGYFAFAHQLAQLRSYVVGGWQASHDQKYRVGADGRMRDVRGHKYGSDRYEEYAPGPVSTREKLAVAAAAAGSAVLWTLLGLN